MATYATLEDLTEYSLFEVTGEDEFLLKVLREAEKDIDRAVGLWPVRTNGMKFIPDEFPASEKACLRDATCAQVEYRLQMGEEFFIQAQPASIHGDDTNYTGRLPRLAPKAKLELLRGGLIRIGARASGGSRFSRYPSYAQRPLSQDTSNSYDGEVE